MKSGLLGRAMMGGALGFLLAATAGAQILTETNAYQEGLDKVSGLQGARYIAISDDGSSVYTAAETINAVGVFQRNERTGDLKQVQVLKSGVNGITGLQGASSIVVSHDGRNVYIGGSFHADSSVFSAFSRDKRTGTLSQIQVLREGIEAPTGLQSTVWTAISPDDRNVYTGSVVDGTVLVWNRGRDGRLALVQSIVNGQNGVTSLSSTFPVVVSGDGRSVYVGSLDNALTVFSRNVKTGLLTKKQVLTQGVGGVDGLNRARAITVSRDGRQVYVAGLLGRTVAVFQRSTDGTLKYSQLLQDAVAGTTGLTGASAVIESSNGRYVFVAGFGAGSIAVFYRHPKTGFLTFAEVQRNDVNNVDGLLGVISLAASEDGKHLYSVSFNQSALAQFDVAGGN
jgi:6-phosphogluconolactonase (cycloisomerase 2 family)